MIVLLAAGNGLARLGSRFAILGAGQAVEADLREELFGSLQRFPPRFYASHATGDLMARATSDLAAVRSIIGFGGLGMVSTLFAFVGALSAMIAVDPWLTVAAMAPAPFLVALVRRFNAQVAERTQAAQEQLGVLSGKVQEYLAGMAMVRAYTMETHAGRDFAAANRVYLDRSVALARAQAHFAPLMALIAGSGMLMILWAGGSAVAAGRLTLGGLVAFTGYLAYLAWPTVALGLTLAVVRRGLTSMARIVEVTAATPPPPPGTLAADGPPAVRFERLTFAYDDRGPALVDVSFAVAPGELVAVVGPTGAGKSTLGLLLARLWEPPPGTVFVGDRDVTTLSCDALRARLGWVPQEAFLFSRSLLDNVTLGRETVDPERARAAGTVAAVAEEVERMPAGWDTVVGERGLTVSGGQRQRLALARALAGGPSLLVLDDVFAAVDPGTEAAILARLRAPGAGHTVLLMTHRLRAAQRADRIVVLVEGRVVETGTHAALVVAGGVYARLWRRQQLEEELARA